MTPFGPDYLRALEYAREVHAGDVRKGTLIPYLAHLVAVSTLVVEDGGDETEAVAALLHDTGEDHGGEERLADVEREFGDRVAAIVRALSDSLEPEDAPKAPWRNRKQDYLAALDEETDPAVLRVSNADKLHNARAILADLRTYGGAVWQRFSTRSGPDQLWYYAQLAGIYERRRSDSVLAHELSVVVEQLEHEHARSGAG